jgi:hypothetical protein
VAEPRQDPEVDLGTVRAQLVREQHRLQVRDRMVGVAVRDEERGKPCSCWDVRRRVGCGSERGNGLDRRAQIARLG